MYVAELRALDEACWKTRWKIAPVGEPEHIADLLDRVTGERVGFAVRGNTSWTATVARHQFTAPTRRQALVGLDAALTALEPARGAAERES